MSDRCSLHNNLEIEMSKSTAEIKARLDSHGKGIRELGSMVIEIRDEMVGTPGKKGVIHEIRDKFNEFDDHVKEGRRFRPIIERNARICERIEKGASTVWSTVITTVSRAAVVGIMGYIAWMVRNGS